MSVFVFLLVQELSNRLDDATQEKSHLLSKVSSLEESISSADQERTILEDKMNALTEGKDEVEKKLASVTESLETEKQVCCFIRNFSVGSLTLRMIACFLWLQNESEDQITLLPLVRKSGQEKYLSRSEKSGSFIKTQGKLTF